jgi:predicted ATPase
MGLHVGEVERQEAHYFGAPLYRCARLMATAHGGQVVLSEAAAALVRDALPAGAGLLDLGEHRLKDLATPERVFQLVHRDLPAAFPALRSLDARPHNLPLQPTSFVGREAELAAVRELLARHRLVTLTGPGGTGKTRLALQVAADVLPEYPDGVWLAELAGLADPALVPPAVAAAAGVREAPGWPVLAALTEALRPRRVLLLLENCEHLVEACARLAEALLRACPDVRLLATSREPLRLSGEQAFPVPPLALPAAGARAAAEALARYAAVALFVERAASVRPGFALTGANAAAVAAICARLDGLPLALELAAARSRLLPPAALLARLEGGPAGTPLRLLSGGARDLPARQQTLRGAITWSHDLLAPDEQRLFRRFGVFAGGCALEAAEAVCGPDGDPGTDPLAPLDGLASLVDKSLLRQEEQPDGAPRLAMLETVREYALERLAASGEAPAIGRRHAAYYLALAEQAEPHLQMSDQVAELGGAREAAWLERLEAEHANLRAALRWWEARASRARASPGDRGPWGGWSGWSRRGHRREGRGWL